MYETNTGKSFPEIFFKNVTKHRKIFSENYFLENILRQNKHNVILTSRDMPL